ncbi:hypothetical protein ICC18_15055 [Paenibacillus sp. WST5]|uniref:Uncharacterized protein n=2 Tax=Paenibacillus sedimenti TaxID=2770274 RepID=A0A926QKG8_9BACL|nr:hypothetical protein [Paenibacillus sedimenti]
MLEVTFNLLLNLYKFPTHLAIDPVKDNEFGIIFGDTLILPFTFIVFVYYARQSPPWRTSLLFALLSIIQEWIYLRLGYMKYLHWNLAYSAAFYVAGFRLGAYLAPRIATYNPPVPYRIRLICFSHTIIMWAGALFASPLLEMFQFRPGVFNDHMADCRFTDLLSGDVLSVLCTIFIPRTPNRFKPLAFTVIACIGISFALYAYFKGWLIYHNWNHFFMVLRYIVPLALIMLYDRWELSMERAK